MDKSVYNIFKTFFKVGTLLLGGGYVILPLLQAELVDKKGWLDSEELCGYYALGQSVPGVIAANTAIFVGYKLNGQKGALAATFGMILPAFLVIVILARMLQEIVNLSWVQSLFWGVGIGVILLLYLATKEMLGKSIKDNFTIAIFIGAFLLSFALDISPALIIIGAIIAGIIYKTHNEGNK